MAQEIKFVSSVDFDPETGKLTVLTGTLFFGDKGQLAVCRPDISFELLTSTIHTMLIARKPNLDDTWVSGVVASYDPRSDAFRWEGVAEFIAGTGYEITIEARQLVESVKDGDIGKQHFPNLADLIRDKLVVEQPPAQE